MEYQYKIIINNRTVYKEFELLADMEEIRVGTTSMCEFRMNPDNFFAPVELIMEKSNGKWAVTCRDGLYVSVGDMRKLMSVDLDHGDVVSICYGDSGDEAFKLRFQIDFEAQIPDYNWFSKIDNRNSLIIGNRGDEDIVIGNNFEQDCRVTMLKASEKWFLEPSSVKYGVYVNGRRINGKVELKNCSFFLVGGVSFYYKDDKLYFDKEYITNTEIEIGEVEARVNSFKYPLFNRNTRIKDQVVDEVISILDPPAIPQKPKDNLLMHLIPAFVMLVLTVVVRGFMSKSSNKSFIIFSVCSMSMGIITSIFTYFHSRKQYKIDCKERISGYSEYIESKKCEISTARQEELEALRNRYRSVNEDIKIALTFDAKLFDRTFDDEDFLVTYLGKGRVESERQIDWKYKESLEVGDELSKIPEQIHDDFKYLNDAPITIPLKEANAICLIGKSQDTYNLSKNMILDIAIRQYQGDLRIYAMVNDDDERFNWIRRLPHVENEIGRRNIVCDTESKNNVFEALYKELSYRATLKKQEGDFILILVSDEHGIKNHPVSKFIGMASELNAMFIFLEERIEDMPLSCSYIITIGDNNKAVLQESEDSTKKKEFVFQYVDDELADEVACKLSPVYCEEISLESSLRKNISFFELLQIYSANDIDLAKRWSESKIYESMAAPLGVNVKDEVIYLDLHEKFHGPHGLVAGTTGSGKSEILQSYIISAATLFHPYELGFVIIDFKGGGMVNQFRDLPHLIGAITNIDGREIDRSLKSIKAELLKRQTLFAEADVNHIDKYIKLFKEHKVTTPLPHLVIVVDEFAELKAEQPEFMKELISAARIGRSLGVHLILATQKPAGQVNEQIWSNSKFKLCLKVQNEADSKEVIKSPLAAEIREPGRAYLQVGNNEVFELFQSAYSGGPSVIEDTNTKKTFRIFEKSFSGKKNLVFEQKAEKTKSAAKTELDAVVDCIHDYCDKANIKRLPNICLAPLVDSVTYDGKANTLEYPQMEIPIGIYDDPDSQYQGDLNINFGAANTLIVGASQTGKTNLLQLIIRSLADNNSPQDVQMYILDFGSMVLKNLEGLKHIGGVVLASEDERVKNFFKLMTIEIEQRKQKLMKAGVSSYLAYKESGKNDIPKVYIFIDNYFAFKELYMDNFEQQFVNVCREGVSLGINVIATNNTSSGFGFRQMANFPQHIALTCSEKSEYSNLFERNKMEPKNVPGRILALVDKNIYEAQTYLAFEGEREFERASAMKEYILATNEKYASFEPAKQIPSIPERLSRALFVKEHFAGLAKRFIPFGLDFSTIDPIGINNADEFELVLIGKKKENVVKFADSFIRSAVMQNKDNGVDLFVLDNYEGVFKPYSETGAIYSIDPADSEQMLNAVLEKLQEKKQILVSGGKIDDKPIQIVLINSKEAVEYISATKPVLAIFNEIAKNFKSFGVLFIFSDVDNAPIPFGGPELMKRVKDGKKALLFDNINQIKVFDIPLGTVRRYTKALESDEAYWMDDSGVTKVKLISETR